MVHLMEHVRITIRYFDARWAVEQIIVQVADKAKAQMLKEFLAALDFVHSINTLTYEHNAADAPEIEPADDFFALAGLWSGRDVEINNLRQHVWPQRS